MKKKIADLILKLKKKIKSNKSLSETELNNLRDLGLMPPIAFPGVIPKTAAKAILKLADKIADKKTGVRRKVSMKGKRPEPPMSPPKAKLEKGLGRTLTEREKQYLKSDSDLNPKNFYKGGVVDIVDAGKYFKYKPKK